MSAINEANHISWLLNDLFHDLTAAVSMGRETIQVHCVSDVDVIKLSGRLRVCNHSIVLSLFKLNEINEVYGSFLKGMPHEVSEGFYRDVKLIKSRNVCQFRNKHVAHIIDLKTKSPISLAKAKELLETITGHDNSQTLEFYDWICPSSHEGKFSVIASIISVRDYCREFIGRDLERP